MTSDVDQKKLRVAIDWISKLANGTNPIDGSTLPDNDIVNNVHISRCLFFVSNLLEDIGKKKPSSKKQYELEFQLTPEIVSNVYIAERTGIAMFVKEINKMHKLLMYDYRHETMNPDSLSVADNDLYSIRSVVYIYL